MTDFLYVTITTESGAIAVSGNTKAEELYQQKRIADALQDIAESLAEIAAKP